MVSGQKSSFGLSKLSSHDVKLTANDCPLLYCIVNSAGRPVSLSIRLAIGGCV